MGAKRILGGLAIIAVIVAAAVFILLSKLDALVAGAIEKHGSEVAGTPVAVSGVEISLREGRGSIRDLTVSSPEGFEARHAFSLADITVDIDLESVRGEPIVIDEIRIRAPVVVAEFNETGRSNLDELRERLQAYGGSESPDPELRNVRISSFVFEQGTVEVDGTRLGVDKRTIPLPEIRLTDVGGAGGAAPDELARVILTAATRKALSEVAASEANRLIRDQLGDSAAEGARGLLEKIGK